MVWDGHPTGRGEEMVGKEQQRRYCAATKFRDNKAADLSACFLHLKYF